MIVIIEAMAILDHHALLATLSFMSVRAVPGNLIIEIGPIIYHYTTDCSVMMSLGYADGDVPVWSSVSSSAMKLS